MNILFLHTVAIDPEKGGIEKVTYVLGNALSASGDGIVYISMMDVYRDSCDKSRQFFFPDAKIYSKNNEIFLLDFLQRHKIDTVIFQAGDDKRLPFPWLFKKFGVRVIIAVHTDPEFYKALVVSKFKLKHGDKMPFWGKIMLKVKKIFRYIKQIKIYRYNAKYADKVVLLSPKFIPGFRKFLRFSDRKKVLAIPNSISNIPKILDFNKKTKEVLYVGRMTLSEKQVHLLLRIWSKVFKQVPDWNLRLLGGGSDINKLKDIVIEKKLERVSFEGFCNPEPYYKRASIFCFTSAFEGFPMVLLEASAFGCVPICFNSYIVAEEIITSGKNGILIPPFDCEKYAESLMNLMSDNAIRTAIGTNAQENVKRFSLEHVLPAWRNILTK